MSIHNSQLFGSDTPGPVGERWNFSWFKFKPQRVGITKDSSGGFLESSRLLEQQMLRLLGSGRDGYGNGNLATHGTRTLNGCRPRDRWKDAGMDRMVKIAIGNIDHRTIH